MKMYFDKLLILLTLFVYLSACLSIYLPISLLVCLIGTARTGRISPDRQAKPGQADQARTGRPSPNGVTPGQDHAQIGPAQAGHALTSPNVQQATHEIAKRAL